MSDVKTTAKVWKDTIPWLDDLEARLSAAEQQLRLLDVANTITTSWAAHTNKRLDMAEQQLPAEWREWKPVPGGSIEALHKLAEQDGFECKVIVRRRR